MKRVVTAIIVYLFVLTIVKADTVDVNSATIENQVAHIAGTERADSFGVMEWFALLNLTLLAATFWVIWWYTNETHKMRLNMSLQTKHMMRPLLIPVGQLREIFNAGQGPAINIVILRCVNKQYRVGSVFVPLPVNQKYELLSYFESNSEREVERETLKAWPKTLHRHLQELLEHESDSILIIYYDAADNAYFSMCYRSDDTLGSKVHLGYLPGSTNWLFDTPMTD